MTATINDFEKLEIRVGKIVKVEYFPEAKKPAYKLWIDFGELGVKTSSAQVTNLYTKDDLKEKQVICVINFPSRKIGPFVSEVLTTGLYRDDNSVVLIVPDKEIKNGAKLG